MGKGQTGRKIGSGMKPRGNQRVKPQTESKTMTEQSTTEGQGTPLEEAVLETQDPNSKGGNLEPENREEPLQTLETGDGSENSFLALNGELEAAIAESGDVVDAEFDDVEQPKGILVAHVAEKPKEFSGGKMAPAVIYEGGADLTKEAGGGSMQLSQVGPMSDGTTRVVITIQEGYWDAVRQWAESDGVPVERWLSDRLYEYISTYGEPAKGR